MKNRAHLQVCEAGETGQSLSAGNACLDRVISHGSTRIKQHIPYQK